MNSQIDKNILVSHSSLDAELAGKLSTLIERCSLKQINVWYSSDDSEASGLAPGQRWFDTIRSNLLNSNAVVVFQTPNSVKSSWVQFEAGFGAGVSDLEIMPLLLGLDIYKVPDPLSQWQIYKLTSRENCLTFLRKMFFKLQVHFDEELVSTLVDEFITYCSELEFSQGKKTDKIGSEQAEMRNFLEKKFFDLHQRIASPETARAAVYDTNFSGYELAVENTFSDDFIMIDIDVTHTIGDILTQIYFKIEKQVKPWTYLSSWILRDIETGQHIVVREVSNEIPAHFVFRPDRMLEIVILKEPYSGVDSEQNAENYG